MLLPHELELRLKLILKLWLEARGAPKLTYYFTPLLNKTQGYCMPYLNKLQGYKINPDRNSNFFKFFFERNNCIV